MQIPAAYINTGAGKGTLHMTMGSPAPYINEYGEWGKQRGPFMTMGNPAVYIDEYGGTGTRGSYITMRNPAA